MSNEDGRMTWWRGVRVARVVLVARVALCGALLCGALLCGALAVAGCTTESNPRSCVDGFCHDPALPFCDVDGTIAGGQRLTCIPVACTPLEFATCRGDEAIVCNATGDDYDVTHCEGGCDAAEGGCAPTHIIPKYLPTVCDQLATEPELVVSESMTLDTRIEANCTGGVVTQINGPSICVVHYGTITIATNKTLIVIGRALALIADQALTIDGILDVSANGLLSGPGGGLISPNTNAGANWPAAIGGAGFQTAGGAGGTANADGGAFNGGPMQMDPAERVTLVGGSRSTPVFLEQPGGGGGAATLVSCRAVVSMSGIIDAGGGGGAAGIDFGSGVGGAASGGGSGGYVVFQGMAVSVTGQVFANGGGGGAGSAPGLTAAPGDDGIRSDSISAPGGASQSGEGAGGAGGRIGTVPGPGKKPATAGRGAGAGGGSTGFFQTYTPEGVTPMLMPVAASPAFQPNRTIPTR